MASSEMEVDSDASDWGPAGVCIAGTNRSDKYFYNDGSLYIRPDKSTTIYCVWGSRLSRRSEFFSDLLTLPLVANTAADGATTTTAAAATATDVPQGSPQIVDQKATDVAAARKAAKDTGGDGKSEQSPLWIQPTAQAFEVFLECVFLELGEVVLKTRPIAFWALALQTADFFGSPVVTNIAKTWLGDRKDFDPMLRLQFAIKYSIADWITPAFRCLVYLPLSSFTTEELNSIGFAAYRILAETQSKITDHRTLCALTVPPVEHSQECLNSGHSDQCNKSWAHAWWGEAIKHGIAVALIHPNRIPGRKILSQLPNIITSYHMVSSCRQQTIRLLSGKDGLLLKEERMISAAVAKLKLLRPHHI